MSSESYNEVQRAEDWLHHRVCGLMVEDQTLV